MIGINRPFYHRQVTHTQNIILRSRTPILMMPKARPMREPGTNYLTYITARGPRTYQG